jgi:ribosomal protein S28E/S33
LKRTTLNTTAVCLFALFTTTLVAAQTRPAAARPREVAPPERQTGTTANEDFDLNITERRITETDFHAETAIEVGDEGARGLNLRVGVAVRASEIDVLLRNVQGHVRFRASLEQVLRLLDSRRAAQQTTTPASPATPP